MDYIKKYDKYIPYLEFVEKYQNAKNAASGSAVDANANVENKNITTMEGEVFKKDFIGINRLAMYNRIHEMYGEELASEYIRQLEEHEIYRHDETAIVGKPYCVSITMYPFLFHGITSIGGLSDAPTNLHSFAGSFINLVFAVASQFAGACLYKDQRLKIFDEKSLINPTAKEFVDSFALNNKFANYQGEWEYADVSNENFSVVESNKLTKINKVFRRKYVKQIYEIKTSTGLCVKTSEDHQFKVMFKGREITVPAKELSLGDTVFCEKDYSQYIDYRCDDYLHGQFIGYVAGDGYICNKNSVRIAINYDHVFIAQRIDELLQRFYKVRGKLVDGHKCFDYQKHSRELVKTLQQAFLPCEKLDAFHKNVSLDGKSLSWMVGFLDGLCASDGCYSGKALKISLVNRPLVETAKEIIKRLDIPCGEIQTTPAHDNKAELYTLAIPVKLTKYLELTKQKPTKNAIYASRINSERDVYYYGKNACKNTNNCTRTDVMACSCGNQRVPFHTDVITSIRRFDNDDDYVYEIETESHWYNCGGMITHNCSTPEFLAYMDYFIRKEYGNDYYLNPDRIVDLSLKGRTIRKVISDVFQQVVYSLNQPAAARSYQSVFWNIAYYDKPYFDGLFDNFVFPDGDAMRWESVSWLQEYFMNWFNEERLKKVLTFPVESMSLLHNGKKYLDPYWKDKTAEMWAKGHSFFCYNSDSVDSLSSCCRLSNHIQENTFSYTLGAGGVSTGSKCVMTININRLVQNAYRDNIAITEAMETQTLKLHKYLIAFNEIMKDRLAHGMLPIYDAGFIDMGRQYLTLGINGFVEGAEFLEIDIVADNPEYIEYGQQILEPMYRLNLKAKDKENGIMFNTEFVPAENLGIKFSKWDKRDGYVVPRDCYNSYFYKVEDDSVNVVDKFKMCGSQLSQYLDGGSAYHCNLDEHLSKVQYLKLLDVAMITGCSYFTYNIPNTICNECGNISKHKLRKCPKCGSENLDYATRVIGYLKRVSCFSEPRQKEAAKRFYQGDKLLD